MGFLTFWPRRNQELSGPTPPSSVPVSRAQTPSNSDLTESHAASNTRKTICVYCGSSPGYNPDHMEAARDLARVMAANNISLVYGGGTVGLMGELAKTLVSLSGPDAVHGIIPEALVKFERDPTYTSQISHGTFNDGRKGENYLAVPAREMYGRTTVVKDMHTRKHLMAQEVMQGGPGSGFIALSGGYGTLEELFETCTWNQLGIHSKGVVAFNVGGFYDGILAWIRKSIDEGFIKEGCRDILVEATTAEQAVRALMEYKVAQSVLKLAWGDE
ncbi:hypothetical protein GQ53DRAFT_666703 [Thozetella sp. PMI_491]|nr:hypothetical protein GQ53DRAFT_666703 [Thozetella sp. PMI_491]